MTYIIGYPFEVAKGNNRYVSTGFIPGNAYKIQMIRYNRETQELEYTFSGPNTLMVSFKTSEDADNMIDRIKGVQRTAPSYA